MVALPLIVRNVFGGGQMEISIMNFCFGAAQYLHHFCFCAVDRLSVAGAPWPAQFAGSISLILVVFAPNFVTFVHAHHLLGIGRGRQYGNGADGRAN